jgi:excinuclease ABC subunit A
VIVIEHNLDVIKTADWVVDMGPEGGNGGGMVVAAGTPEELAAHPSSYTGAFLRNALEPVVEGTTLDGRPAAAQRAPTVTAARRPVRDHEGGAGASAARGARSAAR